jgi:tRNA (guanine37-N1)-methyltransferase
MPRTKKSTFRQELNALLTAEELEQAIFGFDVLGKMALIEIPPGLQKKKKKIAGALLKTNKFIDRVYEKVGTHSGKYRVEKTAWLAGEKNPVAVHKESGCLLFVNPGAVFFNPRLGTERMRIASQIKKNQKVVVFFAGAGPYAVVLAKKSPAKEILAVEWNPEAIPFLEKNIVQNKVTEKVHFLPADVGKQKPVAEFDQVIMPAPETALKYLAKALKWVSKKGGFVHCYFFVHSSDWKKESGKVIQSKLKKLRRKTKIEAIRKVSAFSASKIQVCAKIRVQRI